LIVVYFLK